MDSINILHINPEQVCHLIDKAREFHAREGVTFSEDIPQAEYEYDWAQVLADHADDPTYIEIKNFISLLGNDKKIDLFTLMLLGRGDYVQWEDARKAAINYWPANLTDYLLAHPHLADYLESALHNLGYTC